MSASRTFCEFANSEHQCEHLSFARCQIGRMSNQQQPELEDMKPEFWPVSVPFWIQSAFAYSIRNSTDSHLKKGLEIVVQPSADVVKEAEKRVNEFQTNLNEHAWDTKNEPERHYSPDTLGFFNCNFHNGHELPTGIYLFLERIRHTSALTRDYPTRLAAVFCHELGHYLLHQFYKNHKPSFDPANFAEPFCERIAFMLEFDKDFSDIQNEPRARGFREASLDFKAGRLNARFYHPYNGFGIRKANRFVRTQRPLPYEWFRLLEQEGEGDYLEKAVENMRMPVNTEADRCFENGIKVVLLEATSLRHSRDFLAEKYISEADRIWNEKELLKLSGN